MNRTHSMICALTKEIDAQQAGIPTAAQAVTLSRLVTAWEIGQNRVDFHRGKASPEARARFGQLPVQRKLPTLKDARRIIDVIVSPAERRVDDPVQVPVLEPGSR